MVGLLSKKDGVVVCGAPNLSFLSSLQVDAAKLPNHRTSTAEQPAVLDRSKIYVTFQSNEGDTPKNAYSFREILSMPTASMITRWRGPFHAFRCVSTAVPIV